MGWTAPTLSCSSALTGDLAFKQTFPALQALVRSGRLDMPIVAVGRKALPLEKMRARVRESLEKSGHLDEAAFKKLASQLRYAQVDYDDPSTFAHVKEAIGAAKRPLSYVALPPEVFEKVAKNLASVGLAKDARLVLEKPFGHDAASAKALTRALHAYFLEEAIFRMDHFLGKEQVENIVYFRAANPLVECSLNARHVESVQITMAETFGVKGRAEFYDSVGAVRDVVQNHLLQLAASLAMDSTGRARPGRPPRGAQPAVVADSADREERHRSRSSQGLPRREGSREGLDDRDLRGGAHLHRLSALEGGFPSSSAPARRWRSPRPRP